MISRIRIDAYGASAAEVEATLKAGATISYDSFDAGRLQSPGPEGGPFERIEPDGEMVIERDLKEPYGSPHAFTGRMTCHFNVAEDAAQVDVLRKHGVNVSVYEWDESVKDTVVRVRPALSGLQVTLSGPPGIEVSGGSGGGTTH